MKHLKDCETSWNSRHSMRQYRRSMRRRRSMQRRRRSMRRRRRSMRRRRRSASRRRRSRRGVTGDCGVGITPQMCNRVTNHGDMSTVSKPAPDPDWKKNAHLANISFCSVSVKKIIYIIIIKNPPKFTWYAKLFAFESTTLEKFRSRHEKPNLSWRN